MLLRFPNDMSTLINLGVHVGLAPGTAQGRVPRMGTPEASAGKKPKLPGDDFREEPIGLEPILLMSGEARELDPVDPHDPRAVQFQPLGEFDDGFALEQQGMDFDRSSGWAPHPWRASWPPKWARPCGRCADRHRSAADRPGVSSWGRVFQIGSRRAATICRWIPKSGAPRQVRPPMRQKTPRGQPRANACLPSFWLGPVAASIGWISRM